MAPGWHYTKLSLSSALLSPFSGMCVFLNVLSFCRFRFAVSVLVLLIFFCPADHVLDWQPRILLGMVEARSVNVDAFRFFFKSACFCLRPMGLNVLAL